MIEHSRPRRLQARTHGRPLRTPVPRSPCLTGVQMRDRIHIARRVHRSRPADRQAPHNDVLRRWSAGRNCRARAPSVVATVGQCIAHPNR